MNRERLRGNVESILLATIAEKGPSYGLAISRDVEQESGGEFTFTLGALYPALHRLEKKGLISEEMRRPPNGGGPVSYYTITDEGKKVLAAERREIKNFFQAMRGVGLLRYGL